ncbi:MAG TPA: DNA polymerase III subunit gamma/tau, partial [Microbacterium sp.]|nr:DNA polymerase III subunit gamma/tau [Microbacterium sp.]
LWLAVLTPLIWFVTVLLLTRGGRSWVRILLLVLGALLVLPWPFIM